MLITPSGTIIPQYTGGKVEGVFVRANGVETVLVSGYGGPSKDVRGIPRMNGNIKLHVESHAVVLMRRENLLEATLWINKPPCVTNDPRSLGCHMALPHMLPESAKLRVIGPDGFDHTYEGLADGTTVKITGL
jgi:Double-stranded DNA deaminase toxin A